MNWRRGIAWALALILALVAAALLVGGVSLISQGGSPYYLLAGVATGLSALGLIQGRRYGVIAFGLLLAATLPWALWEAGLDGWALAPRLIAPAVLGLLFLLPPVRSAAGSPSRWWIGAPVLAIIATFAAAGWMAERIDPKLSPARPVPVVADSADAGEWRAFGRTPGGDRHAPLTQINTTNVGKLERAWSYEFPLTSKYFGVELTPLAIGGRLYLCLDNSVVVSLDQETGRQIWRFDPGVTAKNMVPRCRGVSYYEAPPGVTDCVKRLLYGTADGRLLALNADTGRLCASFGQGGAVDLRAGMGPYPRPDAAQPTSPPAIVRGVAIVGQQVLEFTGLDTLSGVVRGYDAVTGQLRWAWDLGRPDRTGMPPPGETYTHDTPMSWSVASADEALGLVYLPTGVSEPDYWGGRRTPEAEKYGNSIVALDAGTGRPRWSFQTVHHDLWDYDVPSQPVLTDIQTPAGVVPGLIAPTKQGQIFVLDRRTGQPIDRVVERPVPQGAGPGDWTSKTQPFTTGFPSVGGADLTEKMMWGTTPIDQLWCRIAFHKLRYEGEFTPPFHGRSLIYPSPAGAMNWGSVSVDGDRGLMVANSVHMAETGTALPFPKDAKSVSEFEQAFIYTQPIMPSAYQTEMFFSPLRIPCQQPPFGVLSVFDTKTRKLVWSKALGTAAPFGPFGVPSMIPFRLGGPSFAGSINTAGGLIFIAGTGDGYFRAFDIGNGRELWRAKLPAVAGSVPMSYVSPASGRQFVAIVAGGFPAFPAPKTGQVVAYTLKKP